MPPDRSRHRDDNPPLRPCVPQRELRKVLMEGGATTTQTKLPAHKTPRLRRHKPSCRASSLPLRPRQPTRETHPPSPGPGSKKTRGCSQRTRRQLNSSTPPTTKACGRTGAFSEALKSCDGTRSLLRYAVCKHPPCSVRRFSRVAKQLSITRQQTRT